MEEERSHQRAVLESALFAAGRALIPGELADLAGLTEEEACALVMELAEDYDRRGSGIEILRLGDGFVMQVRGALAPAVRSLAPRELSSQTVRTLAVIASRQPIRQSELVRIRGNRCYEHVRELERRGLISAERQGRTKVLATTRAFADYFGLPSPGPEAVRRALLGGRRIIGVTPMYESLALRLGLQFVVVNPYTPGPRDLKALEEIDLLVAAPGYSERISENYSGEVIEAGARTLSQLKESVERICLAAGSGDLEPLAAEIDEILHRYRERAALSHPIRPLTPLVEELARDLRVPVSEDGITAGSSGVQAEIEVPVHQPYDMDILERIVQRCEAILLPRSSPSS